MGGHGMADRPHKDQREEPALMKRVARRFEDQSAMMVEACESLPRREWAHVTG
jgi:hypothetical protein